MEKFKNFIRNSIITLLAVGLLNTSVNVRTKSKLEDKLNELKTNATRIEQVLSQNDQKTGELFKEIKEINLPRNYLFRPFWTNNSTEDRVNESNINLQDVIKNYTNRKISLGLALDNGGITRDMASEISKANILLKDYRISADIGEKIEINLPQSFNDQDFKKGVINSFSKPHDYYFVLTPKNYSIKDDRDYAVKTMTESHISLIDGSFNKKNLGDLVSQEILRLFSDAKDAIFEESQTDYSRGVNKEKIMQNILKKFSEEPYKTDINLNKLRSITVNVGLDDVSKEYAKEIIQSSSDIYNKEFGIKFETIGAYDFKLPDSWDLLGIKDDLIARAKKPSDIYLLFTNKDWNSEDASENSSFAGQANVNCGCSWIEVHDKIFNLKNNVVHEIGHLFGAQHLYLKNSVMHPFASYGPNIWAPKTKEIILKNKYSKWN